MLAAIGGGLIWRAMRLRRAGHSHSGHGHDDDHQHEHEHTHGGVTHSHGPVGRGQPITWGSLIAMGFVGGFLPSPSAVVVLLGAIALRRTWFGVVLVVAYGVGMALTLTGAGLVLLKTRGALDRRYITAERRERLAWFSRMLPSGRAWSSSWWGCSWPARASPRSEGPGARLSSKTWRRTLWLAPSPAWHWPARSRPATLERHWDWP
jgi:hypothetical protein